MSTCTHLTAVVALATTVGCAGWWGQPGAPGAAGGEGRPIEVESVRVVADADVALWWR